MPKIRKPDHELTPEALKKRRRNDRYRGALAKKKGIRPKTKRTTETSPKKETKTEPLQRDNERSTGSKKAEDWLQKTIRMDRALFDLIGDTANSLGISDKEFCIQALKSEVQKHVLKVQKNLLAKIKALQAISKETSTN